MARTRRSAQTVPHSRVACPMQRRTQPVATQRSATEPTARPRWTRRCHPMRGWTPERPNLETRRPKRACRPRMRATLRHV
jgi:hypothetical protein